VKSISEGEGRSEKVEELIRLVGRIGWKEYDIVGRYDDEIKSEGTGGQTCAQRCAVQNNVITSRFIFIFQSKVQALRPRHLILSNNIRLLGIGLPYIGGRGCSSYLFGVKIKGLGIF